MTKKKPVVLSPLAAATKAEVERDAARTEAERLRGALEAYVAKCSECRGSGHTCPAGPHCICGMGGNCSGPDIDCPMCAEARAALAGKVQAVTPKADEHLDAIENVIKDLSPQGEQYVAEVQALKADLARVSTELGLPPTIGPAPGEIRRFVVGLDALRAEVARWKLVTGFDDPESPGLEKALAELTTWFNTHTSATSSHGPTAPPHLKFGDAGYFNECSHRGDPTPPTCAGRCSCTARECRCHMENGSGGQCE